MRIRRVWVISIVSIVGVVGFTACSSAKKADLTVAEREFALSSTADHVAAGKVRIKVQNEGKATHEFVVFRTDLPEDGLPATSAGDKIDEEGRGITHLDPEAENVAPGTSKSITIDLAKGRYVFVCNLSTHYRQGMHTVVNVT